MIQVVLALNYKHLRYFWAVAKFGAIARASEQLHLTPQAISGQLSEFEQCLGVKLFRRAGRGLDLTDAGRRIFQYADEIFSLGDELLDVARNESSQVTPAFKVGIADSVAKSVAYRLLEPALQLEESVRLVCREGRLNSLLADLSIHRLDMVISDRPMPANLNVRCYNHLLGESKLMVFGTAALLQSLQGDFPGCLDGEPFLLPGEDVAIRGRLEQWLETHRVRPRVVGEFDDSALLKAFGQAGAGFFVAPAAIADYICAQFSVEAVATISTITEQLYAITTERRLTHPAIIAISHAARNEVFNWFPQEPSRGKAVRAKVVKK
jgi:LysR family transcriptional activator of nhaA